MLETNDYLFQLDTLWSGMSANGMNDSLNNIAQISYLIFLKRIDLIQAKKEATAALFEMDVPNPIFNPLNESCRFSIFKTYSAEKMFRNMTDKVFPFLRFEIDISSETIFAKYMKNAVFNFSNPEILQKAVITIDSVDFENSTIGNSAFNFLLSKIKANPEKGQFQTPAHLVKLMLSITVPGINDKICDPASGTGSFLVAAARDIYEKHKDEMIDENVRHYFETDMFSGYDFDKSMTNISAMNMTLSNVPDANLLTLDSLSANNLHTNEYSLILTNPPFKTTTDPDYVSESLQNGFITNDTAVLFFRLILRMLKSEGRCAAIVPDRLLFGVHKAVRALKEDLLENHKIEAIISLSDPNIQYMGNTSCSIIVFTKDIPGGSDNVWFYNLSSPELIDDAIYRYHHKDNEFSRSRYDNSFFVSKEEIIENNYMLIINRYKKDASLPSHNSAFSAVQDLEISNSILKNELFNLDTLR